MKKLWSIIIFAVAFSGSIYGVNNATDLTDAIQAAAANTEESVTIPIEGIIIGNFEIPATVYPITLLGVTSDAAINANRSGTPLTIDLGAQVTLKKLTITGANESFGIKNSGNLTILKSRLTNNSDGGGIENFGNVSIIESSIDHNTGYGLYSETGEVTFRSSSINDNSSYGIYTFTGPLEIIKSTVNHNRDAGVLIYYATKAYISRSEISGNTGYGIENIYSSLVTINVSVK